MSLILILREEIEPVFVKVTNKCVACDQQDLKLIPCEYCSQTTCVPCSVSCVECLKRVCNGCGIPVKRNDILQLYCEYCQADF